jgi:hypothetical protein
MKIEVTQDHIERGRRSSCRCCPVALAIDAPRYKLLVRPNCLENDSFDGASHVCWLPSEASNFISAFDDVYEDRPEPFTFNLSAECFMK